MTVRLLKPDTYNWIVGPTYGLGEKEFRVVHRDFKELGLLQYCKKSYNKKQGDMRIATPWDSILEVVSADRPESLLGEGLSHAIMSEAARHTQATWEQYIEPALSDLLGSCDFPSTPRGFNWYHGVWQLGQQATASGTYHPDYKSWRFPSWTNPVRYPGGFKNSEIQRIYGIASKSWFDQEYGASFTTLSGAIYDEWDESKNVQHCEYNPALPNYLAMDYGYVNSFVALDIQISPDDTVYVWREYYTRYKSTMEIGKELNDRVNPDNYRIDARWGDPRGADEAAILSLLIGYVASFDVKWKLGIEQIKRLLKAGKLVIDPSCQNLIREMTQLHVKPLARNSQQDLQEFNADGNIQHKVDDHGPDALRYFIGPWFVGGANSHLTDLYGEDYKGSESQDVFTTLVGANRMVLDDLTEMRVGGNGL